ncbi:toll/interleukin-1 receptor domain-containing protein [Actinoplanes subglobosus]|uniref:Toll/interleukin-1 receptor domain-containing protein n=1 Tax=Actinoplanes subglobosus TaxID=1547892 RepID=A0ABV8IHX8_9ACTN
MSDEVFISYRKSDAAAEARLIADRVNQRFGNGSAFFDNQSIELGTDFRRRLWRSLAGCRAVIAVVGPDWAGVVEGGGRRIDRKNDFVRSEIECALRERLRIIPVLVRNAAQPDAASLPKSLRPLADRQYLTITHRSADRDLNYLMDQLTETTPAAHVAVPVLTDRGGIHISGGRIRGDVVNGSKTVNHHGR